MPDRPARRLVVLHPGAELYGADRVLVHVAEAAAQEWDVLVVLPGPGPLEQELAARGIPVRRSRGMLVLRKSLLHPRRLLLLGPRAVASVLVLVRLLRTLRPDVVYVNTITLPTAVLAGRLAGRRVVCHVHEAEPEMPWAVTALLTAPLALAHQVIAISDASAAYASAAWRHVRRRTVVVPNGVPPVGVEQELPVERPERLRLLLVGRLSPRKGTDLAVAALARVRDRGVPAELVLAGDVFPGYEWYEEQLRRQVAELGLQDSVQFAGFVPDPRSLYGAAHVVLVPSRLEPFGLVAVEGMSAGRVVVASEVGGLREIVRSGSTGWLCEPDAESLADVLVACVESWERSREIGARAAVEAVEQFGLGAFGRRLRDVLRS